MTTGKDQKLAEFLLGDAELAHDVVSAAELAALTDKTKFPDTIRKRHRGARTTAHYGTGEQLVQKHILRFADTVAAVHEAKFFGVTQGNAFFEARGKERTYPHIPRAAFRHSVAPISDKLLLRRYIASVLSFGNWPDTEFVTVAVATVLRNYPVDAVRMSGITEGILGAHPASRYATTMRSRIKAHIQTRFAHLPREVVDFGPEGMGVEHTSGSDEFNIACEALAELCPWDVPCYRQVHGEPRSDHNFPNEFHVWLHQNRGSSVQKGKGGWRKRFAPSKYADEAGRQTMFRAHALTCIGCFELIGGAYAYFEKDGRSGKPTRSREHAMILRFPVFKLGHLTAPEIAP